MCGIWYCYCRFFCIIKMAYYLLSICADSIESEMRAHFNNIPKNIVSWLWHMLPEVYNVKQITNDFDFNEFHKHFAAFSYVMSIWCAFENWIFFFSSFCFYWNMIWFQKFSLNYEFFSFYIIHRIRLIDPSSVSLTNIIKVIVLIIFSRYISFW